MVTTLKWWQKSWRPPRVQVNACFVPVVCAYAPTTGYYLTALQAE